MLFGEYQINLQVNTIQYNRKNIYTKYDMNAKLSFGHTIVETPDPIRTL